MRINVKVLKAASLFAGIEETRFYLQGVFVETFEGAIHYTATNGHVLAFFRETDPTYKPSSGIIVPNTAIKAMKVGRKSDGVGEVELLAHPTFRLTLDGLTVSDNLIEASFPDATRVLPTKKPSGKLAQFNSDYLARFQKAASLLDGYKWPVVSHNGEDPALVDFLPSFNDVTGFGVIMPVRAKETLQAIPQWLFEDRKEIVA